MPPEYVNECSKPQGSVDRTRNRVMIKLDGRVGKVLIGPCRTSLDEAEEDLHALRTLPRATVSEFVERLKEGMSREDAVASLAGTSNPFKKRRRYISDQSPVPSQGRVEWTPVKPAAGGEASCTVSPHVALRSRQWGHKVWQNARRRNLRAGNLRKTLGVFCRRTWRRDWRSLAARRFLRCTEREIALQERN